MATELKDKLNRLLENVTRDLDISPTKYKQAVDRYSAVAAWLAEGTYRDISGVPHIYPQGSFRLGTVIRPVRGGVEQGYDIDLVCKFSKEKENTSSKIIKNIAGDRLKENANYEKMLDEEGRRCWTLIYAEQDGIGFHMDILPSVQEEHAHLHELVSQGIPYAIAKHAIAVTHKDSENYVWTRSNPSGYAEWFESINKPAFDLVKSFQKQIIFEQHSKVFNKVEEVPDQLVKTPLQRAIQILKRHRDIRFLGHEWECEKPISMIITTLAAQLYSQERDTYSAISNIVDKLSDLAQLLNPSYSLNKSLLNSSTIKRNPADGSWILANPVNPYENFADRWHEDNNKRARAFFQWVEWVKADIVDILATKDFDVMMKSLEGSLGRDVVKRSASGIQPLVVPVSAPHVIINDPNKPWKKQ